MPHLISKTIIWPNNLGREEKRKEPNVEEQVKGVVKGTEVEIEAMIVLEETTGNSVDNVEANAEEEEIDMIDRLDGKETFNLLSILKHNNYHNIK